MKREKIKSEKKYAESKINTEYIGFGRKTESEVKNLRKKKNIRYKNSREKPLNQELQSFSSENQTGYKREEFKNHTVEQKYFNFIKFNIVYNNKFNFFI